MQSDQRQPVVVADQVSKVYRRLTYRPSLRHEALALLRRCLGARGGARAPDAFWALRDISFAIERGESVAIVGANGSGKSTLFRVLCGITRPTTGRVDVRGRFMPLIALGAGFNPELTGRENVLLSAAIQGFPARQVAASLDDLVAFSELAEVLDTPIKFYSSGMRGRLGISLALTLMPDIVFVDEVLAVGDAAFRDKCIARIEERKAQGGTLLFVSHAESLVARICERAIWIQQGRLMRDGKTADVLREYHAALRTPAGPPIGEGAAHGPIGT
jgi:lipopolysaccharide transport system ATP-binding protein